MGTKSPRKTWIFFFRETRRRKHIGVCFHGLTENSAQRTQKDRIGRKPISGTTLGGAFTSVLMSVGQYPLGGHVLGMGLSVANCTISRPSNKFFSSPDALNDHQTRNVKARCGTWYVNLGPEHAEQGPNLNTQQNRDDQKESQAASSKWELQRFAVKTSRSTAGFLKAVICSCIWKNICYRQ